MLAREDLSQMLLQPIVIVLPKANNEPCHLPPLGVPTEAERPVLVYGGCGNRSTKDKTSARYQPHPPHPNLPTSLWIMLTLSETPGTCCPQVGAGKWMRESR